MTDRTLHRFTLMELLVVMAIISVLTGMVMPVIDAARAGAMAADCTNNLRQIGLAHSLYLNQSDGRAINPLQQGEVGNWINWMFARSELNSERFYQCPALPRESMFDPWGGEGDFENDIRAAYFINAIRAGEWDGGSVPAPDKSRGWIKRHLTFPYTAPLRYTRAENPADTVFITEIHGKFDRLNAGNRANAGMYVDRFYQTDHGDPIIAGSYANLRNVGEHHDDAFNALMGDGHVEEINRTDPQQWVTWEE
ncbi:MAG: type II secretion system protein [Planctomycetota bacterium]